MKTPEKEIIVWIHNGSGQYMPMFFDTEEEAILYEKMTDNWYLTRAYNKIGSVYFRFEKPPAPQKKSITSSPITDTKQS